MAIVEILSRAARPFALYVLALTTAAATFAGSVGAEKLLIVAGLVGGLAGLRSLDKRAPGAGANS